MNLKELRDIPDGDLVPLLKMLSYREREVVKLLAGLGDDYAYTPEEVAHIFKITAKDVMKIQVKGLAKIKRHYESRYLTTKNEPTNSVGVVSVSVALPEFCDEEFVTKQLVDLYVALNGMHCGAGGAGLVVADEQSCTSSVSLEGAPR